MKRKNIATYLNKVREIYTKVTGKSALILARNARKMSQLIQDYNEIVKPREDFNEYELKRVDLCKQYSKTKKTGSKTEFVVKDDAYVIEDSKKEAFESEQKHLAEEYHEALSFRNKQCEDFKEYINEEETETFDKIDNVEGLNGQDIEILMELGMYE